MPLDPRFPRGLQANQERYIKAFEGLTQILAKGLHPNEDSWLTWQKMFNNLIATEEDGNSRPEGEEPDATN